MPGLVPGIFVLAVGSQLRRDGALNQQSLLRGNSSLSLRMGGPTRVDDDSGVVEPFGCLRREAIGPIAMIFDGHFVLLQLLQDNIFGAGRFRGLACTFCQATIDEYCSRSSAWSEDERFDLVDQVQGNQGWLCPLAHRCY